ncbi:MAG: hypothetical protein LBL84_02540 [Candidatus Nomurabacteria bacterium]|nr:hypothetical protein [Candidatus Nomurabacteria bacterium]
MFTLGVYVGDKLVAKGTGPSKQAAQQEAATKAIAIYDKRR